MLCRGCDYPLWNLAPGPCPECGQGFKPSDHEFVPASVAFCCPHCDQSYFGTSAKGHLVPARFRCVNCGQRIHMDSMVVRPARDRPDAKQLQMVPPCLQLDRWAITRWFGTLGWSFVMPGMLLSKVPVQRSLGLSLRFFLPLLVVVGVGLIFPFLLLLGGVLNLRAYLTSDILYYLGTGLFTVTLVATSLLGFVAAWALVVHGWLRLTRSATYGYPRTLSAIMFSSGPMLILAFPCLGAWCGSPIVPIWCLVLAIFAVRSGQETSTKHAILSQISALCCLLVIGAGIFLIVPLLDPGPPGPAPAPAAPMPPPVVGGDGTPSRGMIPE
ncbi:MAG: hypothetical protein VX641_02380 [Planctomycetota bacterium]|nr:hypothetical protein [Planctomycetota bacterium]